MSKFMEVSVGIVLMCLGVGAMVHVMRSGDWWILFPLLFLVGMGYRRRCDNEPERGPEWDGSTGNEDLQKRMKGYCAGYGR